MTGICGWVSEVGTKLEAAKILEDMSKNLRRGTPPTPVLHTSAAAGGVGREVTLYNNDRLIIAIKGRPTFRNKHRGDRVAPALAEAYLTRSEKVLTDLSGPFSLAILDLRDESALLAIDRLGIETLYYAPLSRGLLFGSRASCIVAHPLGSTEIDPQSLFDYLYFHCVPSPRSIYRGQQKLLPGQCIRFRDGRIEKSFYWALSYQEDASKCEVLCEEFRSLLEKAVRNAADDCEPGVFLSGGTDSSAVSGMLSRVKGAPVDTYSIGFKAEGYDEIEYARIASQHFGTRSNEYYVTPQDVVDAIPLIARAYDEPFGNASAVPTYYCARLGASDGKSILLGGDGGDEIFAGNARYAHQLVLETYQNIPAVVRNRVIETLAFGMPGAAVVPPLRKVRSYINQARLPLPDRLESYNFLNKAPLAETLNREFLHSIDPHEPLENLREVYQRADARSVLNRMLHLDLKITLADNDLRKVGRMCELGGVEVRYPMLNEDLVEFSARVPTHLKLRHLRLRYFFKRALKEFLPVQILKKPKHGFGLPFGVWLRDYAPLRFIAQDSLASLRRRGYVSSHFIDALFRQHDKEHAGYYGVMIWVLMMLEQWLIAQKV